MLHILQTALELGFLYALVPMALFLSFRILDIADMTTDGCFVLGTAVSVTMAAAGHPFLAVPGANVSLLKTETIFSLLQKTGIGGDWYEALLAICVTVLAGALLVYFLGTRLGLSIRATGNNIDMVRASSINPTFTITVGLCIANALTALSGAMVGQYQNTADINGGTGIVVIGLACLIIGETVLGRRGVARGVIATVIGSIIYRFIYAIVLYTKIMPVQGLKLVTAVIVALAIAFPTIRKWAAFQTRKNAAARRKGGHGAC